MVVSLVLVCLLAALPLGALVQEAPPASFRDYERQPYKLSEEEFARLRDRVMSRCQVVPGTDPSQAPWYFHYELGLELAETDPQRALDALIEAVGRKPESKRAARMYGVWFLDYLPYLHIADLHVQLGNWDCAADALRISAAREKASFRGADVQLFEDLTLRTNRRMHP